MREGFQCTRVSRKFDAKVGRKIGRFMTAKTTKLNDDRKTELGARIERLTCTIIAAIEAADASYPEAEHALARALGAIIGSNSRDERNRAAAVSIALQVVAGCAENEKLLAKHGRALRPFHSRLN